MKAHILPLLITVICVATISLGFSFIVMDKPLSGDQEEDDVVEEKYEPMTETLIDPMSIPFVGIPIDPPVNGDTQAKVNAVLEAIEVRLENADKDLRQLERKVETYGRERLKH